jgi:transcriptional regulator with XRE-family HTH domain
VTAAPRLEPAEQAWLRKVGMRIRLGRVARGESQEELGARAGVSRVTVGSIERSDHPAVLVSYARLATALQIPLADLMEGAP